jgi:endonuclease YncB( thermonuclease family)
VDRKTRKTVVLNLASFAEMSRNRNDEWVIYEACRLDDFHHNDGDSFRVAFANGMTEDFRLYFVDTPESQFKTYRDGNDNGERIEQQGKYFGGLSLDETTSIGKKARELTVELLSETAFDLYTKHDEVYDSGRFYCVVRLQVKGTHKWLDEILVENGLARIITQPTILPDGTSAERHRNHLRRLEETAKKQRKGAWQ